MFKKRSGTSEICGQLYETKLISLVLFRLLHDDRFEYFYLASNIDEIGCFNHLCFKAKIKGIDRPLLVFIQAKHKDNDNSFVNLDEATNFYDSYSKVVQNFYINCKKSSSDKIFNGNFFDNECIFILYTNARYNNDSGNDFKSAYASTLNDLLATGKNGTQLRYTEKVAEQLAELILREEIVTLAEHFVKFLNKNQSLQIMLDDYILKYHAILAMKVVKVSEIESDEQNSDSMWRILTFREDFFDTKDKCLMLLKQTICKLILHNQSNVNIIKKPVEDVNLKELRNFFEKPCASTLSSLIGTHIQYKNGKLEFVSHRSKSEVQKLEQINLSQITVAEAILLSLKLKVPSTFGNTDLTISETRIDHLAKSISKLCTKYNLINSYKIVTLDETIENDLLRINDDLAGAVGNLLVYDQNTKLFQFADSFTALQNNARILAEKLKMNMLDWHEYRFDVRATLSFPKLSFDCSETAKQILHRLVIYAQQSDQNKVETILKKQIEDYHKTNTPNFQFQPEIIFRNYHGNIQAWWLLKNRGTYLTKDSKIYQKAINTIVIEPQISLLKSTFYMKRMINIEYTTESLQSLQSLLRNKDKKDVLSLASRTVIVTDVTTLTAIKVTQYLETNNIDNYAIVDFDSIVNLTTDDFCALKTELRKTDKILIIVYENLQSNTFWYEKYLKEIGQVVGENQKIIVTNGKYVETVYNAFSLCMNEQRNKEINDDDIIYEKHNLTDLTQESQRYIIKNRNVIFQGHLMSLDLLLDDTSIPFLEGTILNKIICKETIEVGDSISDSNYEEISHLYQDRTVEYIKSHLFSGNICVSNVDCINNAQECSVKNVVSNQQGDQLVDSFFSIYLLEDSNNLTYADSADNNKYFQFACRLDPEKKTYSEDAVDFIVIVNIKNGLSTVTTRITVKKKDIANKVWYVNIKLLNCSKQFKIWQKDEIMVKNTFKTLRYMCQRVVLDNIIRNENIEIRNITSDQNKNLFNEFNEEDFKYICPEVDSNDKQSNSGHNASSNVAKNQSGSKIILDDEQKNAFYKVMVTESFARSFFEFIPTITVTSYNLQDESDNIINDKPHACPENDYSSSKSEDKNMYHFNIRFCCKHRIDLKTFEDIKYDVVILTAAPGLGKSTLLTHLSHQIKKVDKSVWVVRINLLNFSGEFRKWQQDKNIVIDTSKTLNLIFQVILKNKNINVDLRESFNKIYLDCFSGNEWDRFNLNMFIHYYNKRKLLFIFDGFDEVCPDYKHEAMMFLHVIKNYPQKNKMWISSRPYTYILPALARHLGKLFKIEYLSTSEQIDFLCRFWGKSNLIKIKLHEYELQTLLNFMSQVIVVLDDKLKIVCYAFCNYIVTKFQLHEKLKKEHEIKLYIERIEEVHRNINTWTFNRLNSVNTFLGTPLLLSLTADFFVNEVLDIPKVCTQGESVFNIITMYKKNIQTILKKNVFRDKYGMNTDIPHINETYELELKECIHLCKRMGSHVIFGSPLFHKYNLNFNEFKGLAPFNFDETSGITEFNVAINRISKIGLLNFVTDDATPIFIHETFAEYFAVEYICNILKSKTVDYNTKKLILTVILSIIHSEIVKDEHGNMLQTSSSVGSWIQEKCKLDDDFNNVCAKICNEEPLIEKYDDLCTIVQDNSILKQAYIRLINSTSEDFENASFKDDNIEEYLSRSRELDDNLFMMMKPHFKKKFPTFSKQIYYGNTTNSTN